MIPYLIVTLSGCSFRFDAADSRRVQYLSASEVRFDPLTMVRVRSLDIQPELMNAACAWASEFDELKGLYECKYTGAVTTRTCTSNGFNQSCPDVHTVS